jgi:hypothetical protein
MRLRSIALLLSVIPAAVAAQGTNQAAEAAPGDFGAPFKARPLGTGAVKVGPEKGTLVVVGGGSMGPEIYRTFIDAARGPDPDRS